jgi:hypothetical protein
VQCRHKRERNQVSGWRKNIKHKPNTKLRRTNKQKTTKKKKYHNSGTFGEDGKHHVVAKVGIAK